MAGHRRETAQAQGPQAGAQAPLDPARLPGTCGICFEYIGAAGALRRHV